MATLLTLANQISELQKHLLLKGNDAKIDAALAVLGDLVEHTPADTGLHISNWRVYLGRPGTAGPFRPFVPGKHGSTGRANRMAALALARVVLRGATPGVPIFISNQGPAIQSLNAGWSNQEPAGFVERAMLKSRIARQVRISN